MQKLKGEEEWESVRTGIARVNRRFYRGYGKRKEGSRNTWRKDSYGP